MISVETYRAFDMWSRQITAKQALFLPTAASKFTLTQEGLGNIVGAVEGIEGWGGKKNLNRMKKK